MNTANKDALRIVSFNVLNNGYDLEDRQRRMIRVLSKYDPDVMGFQEVIPEWIDFFDNTLCKDYDYVLKYRSVKNSEGAPIYWKKSKFSQVDSGYFWLSETPEVESTGWGSRYWRIVSWVELEVIETGKRFFFFNTHFDFMEIPQNESAKLVISRVKEMCGDKPVFLTADFNMTQEARAYEILTSYFYDINMATDKNMNPTFHNMGKTASVIDFCFANSHVIPLSYRLMDDKPDGEYVSDHNGLCCDVVLN